MFEKNLFGKTKQIYLNLASNLFMSKFYLAGGTGLAVQIGHRESIDLDFFSKEVLNSRNLLSALKKMTPRVVYEDWSTLDLFIDGVKVSFLNYDYPILRPLESDGNLRIASLLDIACMKLSAISGRGSKKDFIDMYFLLDLFPLERLFLAFEEKYRGLDYSREHLKKSLVYFADAEDQPMPKMLVNLKWEKVKEKMLEEVLGV